MKFAREILGLLLIAVLVTAGLATDTLTAADHASGSSAGPLAARGEPRAGCHAHGGNSLPDSQLHHSRLPRSPLSHSPRPAPMSHQCCLTGHDAAAVQASQSPQPSAQCTPVSLQTESAQKLRFLGRLEVSMVLAADPPGTTALRI